MVENKENETLDTLANLQLATRVLEEEHEKKSKLKTQGLGGLDSRKTSDFRVLLAINT